MYPKSEVTECHEVIGGTSRDEGLDLGGILSLIAKQDKEG